MPVEHHACADRAGEKTSYYLDPSHTRRISQDDLREMTMAFIECNRTSHTASLRAPSGRTRLRGLLRRGELARDEVEQALRVALEYLREGRGVSD
jgi:hypothetical protein